MKKFTAFFAVFFLFLSVVSVAAYAVAEAPVTDFTYRETANGIMLTAYKGSDSIVIIPDTVSGKPVVSLSGTCFNNNTTATKIVIPASVTGISGKAFNRCTRLEEISVDENSNFFSSKDGVLYNKAFSKLVAFPGAKSGSFTVPSTVTVIENYAFDHCEKITEIYMYNRVSDIGVHAFSDCRALKSVLLSSNLVSIGGEAFSHCEKLTSLHLPATTEFIGDNAFLGYISFSGEKSYYFTDGIYCVDDTYSEKALIDMDIPYRTEDRYIFDLETGICVSDPKSTLPLGTDIVVTPIDPAPFTAMITGKYSLILAFTVSFMKDNIPYSPKKPCLVFLEGVCPSAVLTASRGYLVTEDACTQSDRLPSDSHISCPIETAGQYIFTASDCFDKKGDVDGDGSLSSYDALTALSASLGLVTLTEEQLQSADTDGDGSVSAADARELLKAASALIPM